MPSTPPADTAHRTWPPPTRRWSMAMTWYDALFAHWPVPVDALRAVVPESLPIDTRDGQAWLSVVPFAMTEIRARWTPAMPWVSAFLEINVRTYVTLGDKPGVFFLSLDAANPLAVTVARATFRLPYYRASMSLTHREGWVDYTSRRTHRGAAPAEFAGRYRPTGDPAEPAPGSLEHWLTERYCLYTTDRHGRPMRGDIHHAPWPLQQAEAELRTNTMASAGGVTLPDEPPVCHYAKRLDVVAWTLRRA